MIWDQVVNVVFRVIDKAIPDPAARDAAKLKVMELEQARDLAELQAEVQLLQAQAATNQVDAASVDPFQRRWRPAVGWVCTAGLAYQFLAQPLLAWASGWAGTPPPPVLELGDLLTLLLGMLGLGGLRTVEKLRDKA